MRNLNAFIYIFFLRVKVINFRVVQNKLRSQFKQQGRDCSVCFFWLQKMCINGKGISLAMSLFINLELRS